MPDEQEDKEEPVLTTRIDGEEVRLLVHIERIEDVEPEEEDPPAKPE
jgi:hypothetical protein